MEERIKAILRTKTTDAVKTKEIVKLFDQRTGAMLLELSGFNTKRNERRKIRT
jgi:hypothetical protein